MNASLLNKSQEFQKWRAALTGPQIQIEACLDSINEQTGLVKYYQGLLRYLRLSQPILDANEKKLEQHVTCFAELSQFKSELDLSSIQLFDKRDQQVQTKKAWLELNLTKQVESKDPVSIRKGVQGLLQLGVFQSWQTSYLTQRHGFLEAQLKSALELDRSLTGKFDPEVQWKKIEQFFDVLYEEAMYFTQIEKFSGSEVKIIPTFWNHIMSMFKRQFQLAMHSSKIHSSFFASHYPRLLRLLRHFVTRTEPSSPPSSSFLDSLSFLQPLFANWSESVLQEGIQKNFGGLRPALPPSQVQMMNLAHTFLVHVETSQSDPVTYATALHHLASALDTLTTRFLPFLLPEKVTEQGSLISCINTLHSHYATLLQGFEEIPEEHWTTLLPSLTRMHVSILQAIDRLLEPLVSQLCGLISQMITHVTWFEEAKAHLILAKGHVQQLHCGNDLHDVLRVFVQTLLEWMVYSFCLVPMTNDKHRLKYMTELGSMEAELSEILEPVHVHLWDLPAYASMKILRSVLFTDWSAELLPEVKQTLNNHPRLVLCHIASTYGISIPQKRNCTPKDCVGWLIDLRELDSLIKLFNTHPEMTPFLDILTITPAS
ncbi:hypothetical protein HMI55_006892 [Coelomomyces lativittatus]|nr:hypothetical protein HMI55_006892 [Coelomomyces lativittatus]